MSYELTDQERAQAVKQNVATLTVRELVYLIPERDHAHFVKLAHDGQDVYAYKIELAPSNATIAYNVWCIDVRVPYSNTPARWLLSAIVENENYSFVITFLDSSNGTYHHITKRFFPKTDEDMHAFEERVNRQVLALLQHFNVFGGEPRDTSN